MSNLYENFLLKEEDTADKNLNASVTNFSETISSKEKELNKLRKKKKKLKRKLANSISLSYKKKKKIKKQRKYLNNEIRCLKQEIQEVTEKNIALINKLSRSELDNEFQRKLLPFIRAIDQLNAKNQQVNWFMDIVMDEMMPCFAARYGKPGKIKMDILPVSERLRPDILETVECPDVLVDQKRYPKQ